MKEGEIKVDAKYVYELDEFSFGLHIDGSWYFRHRAGRPRRGLLKAVYAMAREKNKVIEFHVITRDAIDRLFAGKGLSEEALGREAVSYATRKMVIRIMGAPAAGVA